MHRVAAFQTILLVSLDKTRRFCQPGVAGATPALASKPTILPDRRCFADSCVCRTGVDLARTALASNTALFPDWRSSGNFGVYRTGGDLAHSTPRLHPKLTLGSRRGPWLILCSSLFPNLTIRGFVRLSVGPLVRRPVGLFVRPW